jgi:hypothetical protein
MRTPSSAPTALGITIEVVEDGRETVESHPHQEIPKPLLQITTLTVLDNKNGWPELVPDKKHTLDVLMRWQVVLQGPSTMW